MEFTRTLFGATTIISSLGSSGSRSGNTLELGVDEGMKVIIAELLRAAPAGVLLRNFGAIFRCPTGNEASFQLSRPANNISAFLSHSWRTPGYFKTVALMYHYNVRPAIIVSAVLTVIIYVAEVAIGRPFMPTTQCFVAGLGGQVVSYDLSTSFLVSCSVFFLYWMFGQEFPFSREVLCFLDKCCIHQANEQLKQQGIKQLGAFLSMSDTFVLLWQPEYFTRLWCVYEVAAYNYIHKGHFQNVDFIPLKLPFLCISLFLFHSFAAVCAFVLARFVIFSDWHQTWVAESLSEHAAFAYNSSILVGGLLVGVYLMPSVILWKFCQWHMDDRKLLLRQIREFRVSKAECSISEDRTFVEGKIRSWFGSIEAFERVVHTDIAQLVSEKLEAQGPVPPSTIIVGSLPHLFLFSDMAFCMAIGGQWDQMVRALLVGVSVTCFTDTIAIRVTLCLADRLCGTVCGSLVSAVTFSAVQGICLVQLFPVLPLWVGGLVNLCLAVVTILSFRKDFIFRAWPYCAPHAKVTPLFPPVDQEHMQQQERTQRGLENGLESDAKENV